MLIFNKSDFQKNRHGLLSLVQKWALKRIRGWRPWPWKKPKPRVAEWTFVSSVALLDPSDPKVQSDVINLLRKFPRVRSQEYTLIQNDLVFDVAGLSLAICKDEVVVERRNLKPGLLRDAAYEKNRLYRRLPDKARLGGLGTPVLLIEGKDKKLRLLDGHKRINRIMQLSNGKLGRKTPAIIVCEDDCRPYLISDVLPESTASLFQGENPQRIADWQWAQGVPYARDPDKFLGGGLLSPMLYAPQGGGVVSTGAERRVVQAIGLTVVRLKWLQRHHSSKKNESTRKSKLKLEFKDDFTGQINLDYDVLMRLAVNNSIKFQIELSWMHLERNVIPKLQYAGFGYPSKKSMLDDFGTVCAGCSDEHLWSREAQMYQQIILLLRALVRIQEFESLQSVARRAINGTAGLATKKKSSFASVYKKQHSDEFTAATRMTVGEYLCLVSVLIEDSLVDYYHEFDQIREMIEIIGYFSRVAAEHRLGRTVDVAEKMPQWMAVYILQRLGIEHEEDALSSHWKETMSILSSMQVNREILTYIAVKAYQNFPEFQRVTRMIWM